MVLDWAPTEGRDKDISAELRDALRRPTSDADIEKKIAEMKAARTARDFKKSDALRAELADAGISRGDHQRRHSLAQEIIHC
jgi:cysteinyl-tRNA synthetase